MLPLGTRDWARRLLAEEVAVDETALTTGSAILPVYEKLRRSLCALAGIAGFRSLASRALTLAKSEAPSLSAMQVTEDGSLEVPCEASKGDQLSAGESGVILLAQLIGLLHAFIGEALTLRLLQDAWPNAVFDDCNSEDGRKA
jgi:hypothetical protein